MYPGHPQKQGRQAENPRIKYFDLQAAASECTRPAPHPTPWALVPAPPRGGVTCGLEREYRMAMDTPIFIASTAP
jgi:hypothetical protein